MNIIVQKYGGSSVADKEKLDIISNNLIDEVNKGNSVVCVVSAQGKTTDKLVNLAKEYIGEAVSKCNKEMDMLLSTGELQTVSLLTMILKAKGYDAVGFTGSMAGIITDNNYSNAKILSIVPTNIMNSLNDGKIVIVAGFQGIDKFGNITTLGRGGSDLSAVAIAAAINAEKCEIYTDVDGVYTADPNIIKNAKLIEKISYNEMLEAATSGAKVLHNRAVGVAKKYSLPITVKRYNRVGGCTVVKEDKEDKNLENYAPKIVSIKKDLAKITIVGEGLISDSKYIAKITGVAESLNANIYQISISEVAISIVVENDIVNQLAEKIHKELFG